LIAIRTVNEVPWIVLDRPEKRNALDETGWLGIREALATLSDHDDGLVVITGTPPVFCAGDDITEAARLDPVQLREYAIDVVCATLRAIVEHPGPVIAAVNGDAIGGGGDRRRL